MVLGKFTVPESAVIAAIPFLGYSYAFAFEFGYIYHYHLPYWLIHLSLVQVITVVAVLLIVVMLSQHVATLLPQGPWLGLLFALWEIGAVVWSFMFFVPLLRWRPWYAFVGSSLLLLPLAGFALLLAYRLLVKPIRSRQGTWRQRWTAERMEEIHRPRADLGSQALEKAESAGVTPGLMFGGWVALVGIPMLTGLLANFIASHTETFTIVSAPYSCIVLRVYDDDFICAPFDRKTHVIQRTFAVLPVATSGIAYGEEWLGRMAVAELVDARREAVAVPPLPSDTAKQAHGYPPPAHAPPLPR
jgi:hypothetical protein